MAQNQTSTLVEHVPRCVRAAKHGVQSNGKVSPRRAIVPRCCEAVTYVMSGESRRRSAVPLRVLSDIAELMTDWSATVGDLVEGYEVRCRGMDARSWATDVTGPIDWAFDALSEALPPEQRRAVAPLVYWSCAGFLYEMLQTIDPSGRLLEELTAKLHAGGYVPFVTVDEDDPGAH